MIKRVNMHAGYQRAAAGVVGCLLVSGALGLALGRRAPAPPATDEATGAAMQARPTLAESLNADLTVGDDLAYLSITGKAQYRAWRATLNRPEVIAYHIQQGDSLWSIATENETDVGTLLSLNPEVHPEGIQPGQNLKVVKRFQGLAYHVKSGDTLADIAAAFGVSEEAIRRTNQLSAANTLGKGEVLFLPGARPRTPRNAVASRGSTVRNRMATPAPATPAMAKSVWVWPIEGGLHSSEFGSRWGGWHSGLDIAVKTGTPAVAAAAGTVSFAGWEGGYGYCVIIDHGGGIQTRYAHASALMVTRGQEVSEGTPVIRVGSTGHSTGPHLHFEVLVNGKAVNPRSYLP